MATVTLICLLALGLMLDGGAAWLVDFTINSTTLYDQELSCSANSNGPNSSNLSGIVVIDIVEVHTTSEKKIVTLNSVLRKPITLGINSTTKTFGMLSENEGKLVIGVRFDQNVLKYSCKVTFFDHDFDMVTVEKELDNKANVLMSMLNQRFAAIASGADFDTALQAIEKKYEETSDSVFNISGAVAKLSNKMDGRCDKEDGVFKTLEEISLSLSQLTLRLDQMANETRESQSGCDVYRNSAMRPLVATTLPDSTPVLCDTRTDHGGWTIFLRRENGDVDFQRDWESYEEGFGNFSTNFWLGLKILRSITSMYGDPQELRVDMEYKGKRYYAKYSEFSIGDAESNYKLHVAGYSGTAGDALTYHNGMAFSTMDRDNDVFAGHCAQEYTGAWWHKSCHHANLNGKWGQPNYKGPSWSPTTGSYPLTFVEMKTRLALPDSQ